MVRQIILAGFVVILPAGAQAQGRGAVPSVSHAVAAAPAMPGTRTAMRGGAGHPRTTRPAVRSTQRRFSTPRRIDDEDTGLRSNCSSAPGLGFDAVHQAATCGTGLVGLRRGGLPTSLFFPFFDGGFLGSPVGVEEGSGAQTTPPEVTHPDATETRQRYRAPQPATAPTAETGSSEPTDNEQFVFVRRDGTVFFAVAYAWEKGTLRYVTSQGLRHTVAQDALDLDATRQFNEQRGLNFRSPA